MPDNKWEGFRDSIVSTVRGRVSDFLKKNADAERFVLERSERFARLYAEYLVTKNEGLKNSMAIVQQSIENEISAVAVNASTETRNIFQAILGTAIDSLFRALPALL
jgi:hypothetical protein